MPNYSRPRPSPATVSPLGFVPKALDAEELDHYLSSLLLPQVFHTLKYFPVSLSASTCRKALSFLTFCIITKTNKSTPACKSLGLRLVSRKSFLSSISIYFFLKFVLPFWRTIYNESDFNQRNNANASSRDNEDVPYPTRSVEQVARTRQAKILKFFDTTLPLLRVLLLIKCWGKFNKLTLTPSLEQFLAGFQYEEVSTKTHSSSPSKISAIHVLYAHRRWIHEHLSRCIPLLIVPLMQSARESRQLIIDWIDFLLIGPSRRLFSNHSMVVTNRNNMRCPICQKNPITIPVQTNCDHVFCYCCLFEVMQKGGRHCQICQQHITFCKPLQIDKIQ